MLFTLAGLAGIAVSVTGNETAQRYGRSRVVLWAMTAAAALSLATGWTTGISVRSPPLSVLAWNTAIYLDSSALTAGTVQAADKHLRGATMGLHSMAGYAGGFLGPLGVGLVLDLAGGDGMLGWGLAFGHLAIVTLAGLVVLRRLGAERRATPAMTRPVHPHVYFSSAVCLLAEPNARSGMSSGRASGALNHCGDPGGSAGHAFCRPHRSPRRAWYQPA